MLDRDVLLQKIQETVDLGGDQILMQGGLHPALQARVVRRAAARHQGAFPAGQHPRLQPAGDPPLHQGREAAAADGARAAEGRPGLGSLPGGGGEILVDRVRKEITRGKVLTDDWLERPPRLARAGRPLARRR